MYLKLKIHAIYRQKKPQHCCRGFSSGSRYQSSRAAAKIQMETSDNKYDLHISVEVFMLALPIFPGSRPPSIVGVHVLNFCVRDGNRWTHMTINTNLLTLVTHTGFEPMLTA